MLPRRFHRYRSLWHQTPRRARALSRWQPASLSRIKAPLLNRLRRQTLQKTLSLLSLTSSLYLRRVSKKANRSRLTRPTPRAAQTRKMARSSSVCTAVARRSSPATCGCRLIFTYTTAHSLSSAQALAVGKLSRKNRTCASTCGFITTSGPLPALRSAARASGLKATCETTKGVTLVKSKITDNCKSMIIYQSFFLLLGLLNAPSARLDTTERTFSRLTCSDASARSASLTLTTSQTS